MIKQAYFRKTGALVVGLVLLTASVGWAQRRINTRFVPYSSVSFGVGTSAYYGDLAGYRRAFRATYILPRWNVGMGYTRQFTPHFAARATFTWARIVGDDYTFNKNNPTKYAAQFVRNLHFRNDLKEFAITGMYNFIAEGRNSAYRPKWSPYVFGGIALVAHSPEARTPENETHPDSSRRWVKLQPLHTEGQGQPGHSKPYSLVTVAIPVGFGVKYRLNENFNIGAEIGFRYTFTDYLDDTGGNYAAPNVLQGLASTMADRRTEYTDARIKGSSARFTQAQALFNTQPDLFTTPIRGAAGLLHDGYLLTNFSIQYIIPGKIKCPPIK